MTTAASRVVGSCQDTTSRLSTSSPAATRSAASRYATVVKERPWSSARMTFSGIFSAAAHTNCHSVILHRLLMLCEGCDHGLIKAMSLVHRCVAERWSNDGRGWPEGRSDLLGRHRAKRNRCTTSRLWAWNWLSCSDFSIPSANGLEVHGRPSTSCFETCAGLEAGRGGGPCLERPAFVPSRSLRPTATTGEWVGNSPN